MPRTKVSKSSKRNREAANREEKIREFENTLEGFQTTFEAKVQDCLSLYEEKFSMLRKTIGTALLEMKICDLFEMDFKRFADWEKKKQRNDENSLSSSINSALLKSAKAANPNDEEDSSTGGSLGSSTAHAAYLNSSNMRTQQLAPHQTARLRTPGPLSSARARRPRRSRSACGDYGIPGSAIKKKSSSQLSVNAVGDHHSRSKMRTPMASRTKALSADRTPKLVNDADLPSSPPTFLRFPRAGELVLSKCGSPLVSNTIPDNYAHLNIPLRNGVISMRPKKLAELQPNILEAMDPETLEQLRTLHANIDKIVSMADKAGFI
ncbi:borealin isoform X2 [Stomoxys calcitrans]|uniref:Borealin C-terminal domain-containing protein n=1 Tax=Stomoxys calcitrans TaxID=35570 RepID=A0A1I8P669_STOCA|nr:borealin isoform X2 [Stomoxys calcitrans]